MATIPFVERKERFHHKQLNAQDLIEFTKNTQAIAFSKPLFILLRKSVEQKRIQKSCKKAFLSPIFKKDQEKSSELQTNIIDFHYFKNHRRNCKGWASQSSYRPKTSHQSTTWILTKKRLSK